MRALVTTHPAFGHFHPMADLAQAMRGAGDEVLFASSRSFLPVVERAGFAAAAAGMDWLESEIESTFPDLARDDGLRRDPLRIVSEVFGDAAPRSMVPDLLSLIEGWKPDVVVRNDFELAGPVAAERCGLPCVTVGVDFFMPPHIWRALVGPPLTRVRQYFGLPARPDGQAGRHLFLSFMPPSYWLPELQRGTAGCFRPPLFDGPRGEAVPEWLASLPAGRTVYFTLGTVFNRSPDVLRCVVEGLRDQPFTVVATVGRNQDPSVLGELPDNVHVAQYVPQGLVMDRCAAVVTHGGFGPVMAALTRGLPLVVIPLSAHQPIHAGRCLALGVGRVLRPRGAFAEYFREPLPPEISAEAVRDAVHAVVEEPAYRRRAQAMRDEIAALPGAKRAVEEIHHFLARQVPGRAAG